MIWDRLKQYEAIFSRLATWPTLVILWGKFMLVFIINMGTRARHMTPAGMHMLDLPCASPLCDFSVFWQAGQMIQHNQTVGIYNTAVFLAMRKQIFSAAADPLTWFYPPPALFAVLPVSYLPGEVAFWVWIISLLVISAALLRIVNLSWRVVILGLLSPAALWSMELGQFGLVCGALLMTGLIASERRPLLSGISLGLLIIKPQAALLSPLALLVKHRYKALFYGALTSTIVVLLSILVFGWPTWQIYLSAGLAESKHELITLSVTQGSAPFGLSVFNMMRAFGAGVAFSSAVQSLVTLLSIIATWYVWRSHLGLNERTALCICLCLLATPYGGADYMIGYSISLVILAESRSWRIDFIDVICWLWPVLTPVVYDLTHWQLSPVIVILATWRIWQCAHRSAELRGEDFHTQLQ